VKKISKSFAMAVTAAAVLLFVLLPGAAFSQTAASADTPAGTPGSREEVVYANLTPAGDTKEIYVVSVLHNTAAGLVADFGNFTSVSNLTDTAPVTLTEDQVLASVPQGDFYYQGTLESAALPWTIDVSYALDGAELPAEALAGTDGHVTIRIRTDRNTDIDPVYFDNYLLQVSLTLDTSRCKSITASGGTLANAGVNKLVTFTVMPGKAGDLVIETDASDFSMSGIEFSAVPLSMKLDPPDTSAMKADLKKLSDAVAELNDGIAQLESGSLELKSGAEDLSSGSSSVAAGLRDLSGNAAELYGGSAQIKEALNAIVAAMSAPGGSLDLGSLQQLPDGLLQLAAGLDGMSSGLTELKTGFAASYGALKAAILEIPGAAVSDAEWGRLYQDNPDKKDLLDRLAAYYASGLKTKATYENVRPLFDAMEPSLDELTASVGQMSGSLKETAAQIKGALESDEAFSQLSQLSSGLQALSEKYGGFHDGLVQFTAGVAELNKNYGSLDAGISGLADGAGELSDGLIETSDGVTELNDGVSDLPEKTDEEIQKLMDDYDKSDVTPVSFASAKNANTLSVQFVIKTDKIEKPDAPAPAAEPEAPVTIWTRIADLFR
jgi:X-X-X-Leu-X-X-Gly heptad repeat protein